MNQDRFSNPNEDNYGFGLRFLGCTNEALVVAFNREVGKDDRIDSRADYLYHLLKEFQVRNLDCSAITVGRTLSLQKRVRLVENKLVV